MRVLEVQIRLLLEGKRDLKRDLIARRETEMRKEETPEEVVNSRETIRQQYQSHIVRLVEPIKEYWQKLPFKNIDPIDLL